MKPSAKVLIVEDDPALLRGLKDNFTYEGYTVQTAMDGEAGLEAAIEGQADLIVLDIMLPKVNGYEVCRALRSEGIGTPVLMLTAKSEESDVVLGLHIGADDYVTKPFSIRELLARAEALLRRARSGDAGEPICFGPYRLDLDARTLVKDGAAVALTPKEYGVLALLAGRPGRAYTREDILRRVWGYNVFVTGRSVDRAVATLRGKLEPDPKAPTYIQTVREIGYRFDAGA